MNWRKQSIRTAFFILLLFLPRLASAEPEVTITYDYYDVTGRTAEELKEGMKGYGVKWDDGKRYDAFTGWYVEWDVIFDSVENLCVIDEVITKVSVTYFLPRWKGAGEADRRLRKRWDRFIDALREHEEGHKEIAVEAAREVEKEVVKLNSYHGCGTLRKNADATAEKIIRKYIREQQAYDEKTKHGRTQGGVFP